MAVIDEHGPAPRVLLSGIPGAGKTTMACELDRRFSLRHIDMEANRFELADAAVQDPTGFAEGLPDAGVVVSWGFGPHAAIDAIRAIVDVGFVPVWLDGDRARCYTEFMRRERALQRRRRLVDAMEAAFLRQVASIIESEVIAAIPWTIVDPFLSDGRRRQGLPEEIMRGVMGRTGG